MAVAGAGVPAAAEVDPAELAVVLPVVAVDFCVRVARLAVLFAVVGTVVPVTVEALEFRAVAERAPVVLTALGATMALPFVCAVGKTIPVGRGIWLRKASIEEGNSAVAS